jgi:transposase
MRVNYIGMDVHKTSTAIVVVNKEGKVQQRTVVNTDGKTLRGLVSALPGRKELTFEEGSMSEWLFGMFEPVVDRLVICNPIANKTEFRGNKNDLLDAERLAELLRIGHLKPVYHEAHPLREIQSCLRTYRQVTGDLVRAKNRLKVLFLSRGISVSGEVYEREGGDLAAQGLSDPSDRERYQYLMDHVEFFTRQKELLTGDLVKKAKHYKDYRILQTIPGIGPIHAAELMGVVLTPHRFRTKRQFWRYCGLAVVKRTSSDWVQGVRGLERRNFEQTLGLNRDRHPVMKGAFMQAALVVKRSSPFKELYDSFIARGHSEALARVYIARKLAAITLTVWKQGGKFRPEMITSNPS